MIIALFLLPALTQLGAQEVMTLHDCMEYAVSNSTRMRIQQAAVDDAQLARRDAILAACTPTVSASTYAYYNFGRSIDPQTNTYFSTTSFHNNYGISAGFELFNGFQAVNNAKISRTGLLIARSQQKQAEADICLSVMQAYYNVVYFKRLADVYEEQVAAAETSLRKAERQEELGQAGHADVVQMKADLADRRFDLISTKNQYESEKMTLSDLMYWPLDQELDIDSSLPDYRLSSSSASEVVDYAMEHNPGVKSAEWTMQNAKRELVTARWQLLPSIGVYAGWNTSYYTYQGSGTAPFRNQFKNNGGEYVQMSLSIPLFNRLSSFSKISRKKNAVTRASAEYDQKRRDVESEIRRAILDRDGTATAYQQARLKGEVQEEAYNLNLKKLDQGLISPLEFQTAGNNYLKAKADEMKSLFNYLIKHAVVNYYHGVEYINQYQ